MRLGRLALFLTVGLAAASLAGCTVDSYPAGKIKQSLSDICRKEYGIEGLDVKVVGTTIGVYLPLEELFAADFAEAAVSGKVRNLDTLFEPSQEAMEKVEDVLFSISRVLLSTSQKFDFYILFASDVQRTGLQLVLIGNVEDIKRVRIWDISRDEYRKRVMHELRLNRSLRWQHPVRSFFTDLGRLTVDAMRDRYFGGTIPAVALETLFLKKILRGYANEPRYEWEVLDLRSAPPQDQKALVYAKVLPREFRGGKEVPGAASLEYLFVLAVEETGLRFVRVIPFQYEDLDGVQRQIAFPAGLEIEKNLDQWEQSFEVKEIQQGPFLAGQLTRRAQFLVATDERVQNTFRDVRIDFQYQEAPPPARFDLNLQATLKDFNRYPQGSVVFHEDMLYLLNLISREFVDVLRSYHFGHFDHLAVKVDQEPFSFILAREELELFRRKKVDIQGLFSSLPAF